MNNKGDAPVSFANPRRQVFSLQGPFMLLVHVEIGSKRLRFQQQPRGPADVNA